MEINQIIKQWIETGSKISFWGASDSSIYKIQQFLKKYGKFEMGYIYDSYPKKESIYVFNNVFKIKKGNEYNVKDTKLVMCLIRHNSYHKVVSDIEKNNAVYGIDYIDIDECINGGSGTKEYPYEKIVPYATYAPWREDDDFIYIFNKIRRNTLVDIYRLYSLWISCRESAKCRRGDIIEIGVWRGGTGTLLGYAMNKYCIEKNTKLYLCDTFSGVVKAGREDVYYSGGEHSDTSLDIVKRLLYNCNVVNTDIIKGIFPDDCFEKFECKQFRLAHIDVDVYKSAEEIFNYIWPKMIIGGLVIFDDYGFDTTTGVTKLCKKLEKEIIDGRCVFNLNGEAIFIKCGYNE